MATSVERSKRTLAQILEESAAAEKKLVFKGPDNLRPDSRHAITEIAADHVVFRLFGDEAFVLPYTSILALRVATTQLTVRYQ